MGVYEARSPLGLFSLPLPTAQRHWVCPREEKVEGCQRVFGERGKAGPLHTYR